MPAPKPKQYSVGTTETQVCEESMTRTSIIVYNTHDTATIYWGTNSGVTSSTGFPLKPKTSIVLRVPEDDPTHEVWVISDTASTVVGVYEGYGIVPAGEIPRPDDQEEPEDPPWAVHPMRVGIYAGSKEREPKIRI